MVDHRVVGEHTTVGEDRYVRRNDQAGPALGEIHLQCQTLAADRAEFAARDSSDARACDAVVDRDVADFNRIVDLGRRTGSTVWGSHYYMGLSLVDIVLPLQPSVHAGNSVLPRRVKNRRIIALRPAQFLSV